jgi:hypothetical protein
MTLNVPAMDATAGVRIAKSEPVRGGEGIGA